MDIGGYFRLNYHRLLMIIDGYFINGYWWLSMLNYHKSLMTISGYYINGYWWLF